MTELDTYRSKQKGVCLCGLVHVHHFLALFTEGLETVTPQEERAVPIIQTLVPNYHFPVKGMRAPERSGWFHGWGRENTK